MYFPIGWPKTVNLALPGESNNINHICFDAVKILLAAVGTDFIGVWYANPLLPIAYHKRSKESVINFGENRIVIWKPDSRQLIVLTTKGVLILYQVDYDDIGNGIFQQIDPPSQNLKRDSAELFLKENIPKLSLKKVCLKHLSSTVTAVCCISLTELLVATEQCELIRIQWSELERSETMVGPINLRKIQFYVNQQCNIKTIPPVRPDSYVASLEYSPFIGGCAAVFNDKRSAFLIANHLRFELENMHGFWLPDVDDATVCSVNHKFRLLTYGRTNSEVSVYAIEDATGGLEFSHRLSLNATVLPGTLGAVNELKWSPDGCVIVVTWENGGLAVWSTFGALLMSSFSWDFGINIDLAHDNPLCVSKVEWSTEGYQLFLTCKHKRIEENATDEPFSNVCRMSFVKSTLTMNPCMTSHSHILLQGDDTLYLNQGDNLEKIYFGGKFVFPNNKTETNSETLGSLEYANDDEDCVEIKSAVDISSILSESKYWTVLQLPQTYAATNWPIRYSAIDADGIHLAVAGRTGLAHYSMVTKKWKLFGNELQEKDFVVSGGLLWWKGFIVCGCYSLPDRTDEIRCYPEECRLDNQYGNRIQVRAPIISLNMFRDQLIALTADGIVTLFAMFKCSAQTLKADCAYEVDVKSICIHPACIVSLTVTNLRNDLTNKVLVSSGNSEAAETIIVNVCGRILMIQRDNNNTVVNSLMASCLASCVECFWLSNTVQESSPMKDCLWLFSGVHGMRVWLPILPPSNAQKREGSQRLHTFMSKRIMLSFPLKLYPLVILFDNVIVLGVENETTLYTSETKSHYSLPFSQLERKSQVYLHKILRQLIKRNLGYSAWDIAQSCRRLPYFPHTLELLLHEVLEEEATSKEPIPDALLPSILDFIREFPVYLQTIVQCARKTEIALWPYLFSMAGKPKDLFQQCLESEELVTAASYLIILQNLEPSIISRQYATLLLEIALQHRNWELAKDLIRFLKAIDPNEIDSPRSSMVVNVKIAPPSQAQSKVNQNPDAFNLVLGPISRERSFSTTVLVNSTSKEKKEKISAVNTNSNNDSLITNSTNGLSSVVHRKSERTNSNKNERRETFCIETILYRHARKLLQHCKVMDLGYMSAFLDFHLVSWLSQEADKTGRLDDYIVALCLLHEELKLPTPATPYSPSDESDHDYNHIQQRFQLDKQKNLPHTSSQTSESGYFSLPKMDTPTSTQYESKLMQTNIPSIKENEELQYSSLMQPIKHNQLTTAHDYNPKSLSSSQTSLDHPTTAYRRFCSLNDDVLSSLALGLNCAEVQHKIVPEKLAIKMRYLLQLFIEAKCLDFALVLSILLQDAASVGRIINVVIRSESLAACAHIQTSLKHVAQWSFDNECVYRSFMISLQPHIYLLDQFIQTSANTALRTSSSTGLVKSVQSNLYKGRTSDNSDHIDSSKGGEHQVDALKTILQSQCKNSLQTSSIGVSSMKNQNLGYDKFSVENKHIRLARHLSIESVTKSSTAFTQQSMENAKRSSSQHKNLDRNESSGCIIM